MAVPDVMAICSSREMRMAAMKRASSALGGMN